MATYGVSQDTVPALIVTGNLNQTGIVDNIVAKAGGAQQTSGASVILPNTYLARVITVGTAADSVTLPSASVSGVGCEVIVRNDAAANSMNVFPALGDTVNILSANAAFAVAAGKSCSFICTSVTASTGAGRWVTMLSA